jgi:hypothetical protein
MAINYWSFIEPNFSIINKEGQVVPFILNAPQDKYLVSLVNHYGKELRGVRDIILKGRKMGFSSIIAAIFATDFLIEDYPVASVIIANTHEETKKIMGRTKYFMNSCLSKSGKTIDDICDTSNTNELINKINGATFHIGTAGSKTALRVDSIQNLHFSEAAHFQDTDIITARETIEGALQMVDQGIGKVFIESTANGYGNYFQILEEKAYKGQSKFRSVFFGADELYSKEWLAEKEKEFTTREMYKQEYPLTRAEAYMSSGSKFFDSNGIQHLQDMVRTPIQQGQINSFGELI